MHYRILHIHLHLRHLSAMGSFSEDELQTGMEQCGLDWSSEEVEIVDSMNEGTMKFGDISPGVSEASRRESLTFSLEPQLLRAAPLQVVLSGWCKHWKGLRVESGEELFELSQPVQSIDVFLSHDWETSRWMKLLVMLLVFNSPAAAAASLLVSIAVGVGQASGGVVPEENLWLCFHFHATKGSISWSTVLLAKNPRSL